MTITLIVGGARSGKSRYAEILAKSLTDHPVYVATSRPWDDDHQARIERHKRDRGPEWETIEEELRLSSLEVRRRVVVVDCVTLWLTNFFVDHGQQLDDCLNAARAELDRTFAVDNDWIFVSNEVGQSLHPPTEAGRKFTDLQGFINQHIASRADRVALVVTGIPLFVKGEQPRSMP